MEPKLEKLLAERDQLQSDLAAKTEDLKTAIEDSNRSRQIIYAMSDALKPREGESNIDCAKRVASDLLASQQREAGLRTALEAVMNHEISSNRNYEGPNRARALARSALSHSPAPRLVPRDVLERCVEALNWYESHIESNLEGGGKHHCPWCYKSGNGGEARYEEIEHTKDCVIGIALTAAKAELANGGKV